MYIPWLLRPSKGGLCWSSLPHAPSEWILHTPRSRCAASFSRARLRGNLFKFRDGWQNYDLKCTLRREVRMEKRGKEQESIVTGMRRKDTFSSLTHIWYLDTTLSPRPKEKLDLKEILFLSLFFLKNIYLLFGLCWVLCGTTRFCCGHVFRLTHEMGSFGSLPRDHAPIASRFLYTETQGKPQRSSCSKWHGQQ